jgi:hypothetical protein
MPLRSDNRLSIDRVAEAMRQLGGDGYAYTKRMSAAQFRSAATTLAPTLADVFGLLEGLLDTGKRNPPIGEAVFSLY